MGVYVYLQINIDNGRKLKLLGRPNHDVGGNALKLVIYFLRSLKLVIEVEQFVLALRIFFVNLLGGIKPIYRRF